MLPLLQDLDGGPVPVLTGLGQICLFFVVAVNACGHFGAECLRGMSNGRGFRMKMMRDHMTQERKLSCDHEQAFTVVGEI